MRRRRHRLLRHERCDLDVGFGVVLVPGFESDLCFLLLRLPDLRRRRHADAAVGRWRWRPHQNAGIDRQRGPEQPRRSLRR